MAYFIHNKYDKASIDALAAIDQTANTVVDYYGDYETYKYLDTSAGFGILYDTLSYVTPGTVIHDGQSDKDNSHFNFQSSIVVKSIQRGNFLISTTTILSNTIEISKIDSTKAIIFFNSSSNSLQPYLESVQDTSFTLAWSKGYSNVYIDWQVIEYC